MTMDHPNFECFQIRPPHCSIKHQHKSTHLHGNLQKFFPGVGKVSGKSGGWFGGASSTVLLPLETQARLMCGQKCYLLTVEPGFSSLDYNILSFFLVLFVQLSMFRLITFLFFYSLVLGKTVIFVVNWWNWLCHKIDSDCVCCPRIFLRKECEEKNSPTHRMWTFLLDWNFSEQLWRHR